MNIEELLNHLEGLIDKVNLKTIRHLYPEILEFVRLYAGKDNEFYSSLKKLEAETVFEGMQTRGRLGDEYSVKYTKGVLTSLKDYMSSGLLSSTSLIRQAQIDVVSDILEQAQKLLKAKNTHPAAATVLIGATLEEFLRNWIEDEQLPIRSKNPSIDTYAKALKEDDFITKQDFKDITSWAGLRNHAAHGEFEEVEDKKRISIMLEGVDLFMRKYGSS